VDVVVHLGMLVVAGDVLMAEFGIMEHQQWVGDVAAALAIPVWARALGIIVPANARLGALLYTLGRMVEEVGDSTGPLTPAVERHACEAASSL
jgi:hypothetical protein